MCKICHEKNIPIIPHGTGTGLEAGISALHGGICIDLQKMDDILDYHPEDFDVSVRPGVTREGQDFLKLYRAHLATRKL